MAAELERLETVKRDVVADTRNVSLQVQPTDSGHTAPVMHINGIDGMERMPITSHAHGQIAERLKIPRQHYRRLLADHPDLLAYSVNTLFNREPEKRMVRTLDGKARALMSDKYRPLDNYDLAMAVLPILQEQAGMTVESCDITDTRMYIKAFFPGTEAPVTPKVGDIVRSGVTITNSEVGAGALAIQPSFLELWCTNGCTTDIGSKRRTHVGARQAGNGEAFELYRDETKRQTDKAFWMQVQDAVRNLTERETFEKILAEIQRAAGNMIEGNPTAAVELVRQRFSYTEEMGGNILRHLVEDAGQFGLSQRGIASAITRASQDVDDYDAASTMERDGGKVIELPQQQWQEIALAA
jgi:hypothetical protein